MLALVQPVYNICLTICPPVYWHHALLCGIKWHHMMLHSRTLMHSQLMHCIVMQSHAALCRTVRRSMLMCPWCSAVWNHALHGIPCEWICYLREKLWVKFWPLSSSKSNTQWELLTIFYKKHNIQHFQFGLGLVVNS